MNTKNILILFAHPAYQKSRANQYLIEAVRHLEQVTVHDLYEEYPDFDIEVPREQGLLVAHDIIVFHHPLYWYSSPAILKEWQDLVLEHDFAYGHAGTALRGKQLLSVITTGGSRSVYQKDGYNRFTIREFLAPFEQTAVLCGMRYLPPYVVHGMHQRPGDEIMRQYAEAYRELLVRLRDNALSLEHLGADAYLNDVLDHNLPNLEDSDA